MSAHLNNKINITFTMTAVKSSEKKGKVINAHTTKATNENKNNNIKSGFERLALQQKEIKSW